MDDLFVKPLIGALITALVPIVVGQILLTKTQAGQELSQPKSNILRLVLLCVGILVFALIWTRRTPSTITSPALQSVEVQPNPAKRQTTVDLTVHMNRPAPAGGASIFLESSNKSVLPINGNVLIPEGGTVGTTTAVVTGTPPNDLPITIRANYDGHSTYTDLVISKPNSSDTNHGDAADRTHEQSGREPSAEHKSAPVIKDAAPASASKVSSIPSAPISTSSPPRAALSTELLGRLEEAQGRLSAEKSYWEGVKQHMPAGTSLRPEITSQIFAADSTSQRCSRAREESDAAALSSCIDALNDHLTQLKIQH